MDIELATKADLAGKANSNHTHSYTNLNDKPNIPTKTSQLTNDNDFVTTSQIPSVPTKTSQLANDSGFMTNGALGVSFSNNGTGLAATNVDAAIKELKALIDSLGATGE